MAGRALYLITMTHDGAGGYWLSFGSIGLYRLKDGAWTRYRGRPELPPEEARVRCPTSGVLMAFTDGLGRVWLGCRRSALTLLQGDREQTFGEKDGLNVGNVLAFFGKGPKMWVGGEFGLQQFDQGRFHTIRAADDEALRGISGIVETANGDLWLNGLGGIVHIRRAEIEEALRDPAHSVRTERFDRRAGLPGLASQLRRMPTATEGTDGRLWFNVSSGVVWLQPEAAATSSPALRASIRSVAADGKGYEIGRDLTFPAGTSDVQIGYAGVSLARPEAIRFRYRLHEVDRDWHDAGGATSVNYRWLPPGSYRFEVGATDANAAFSDQTATMQFTILPAFHQTSWFRALVALLLLALAWVAYRWRIRSLQRRFEMTLDARVGERTRIARELHDTLLQSFHGLLLRFQTAFDLLPDRSVEREAGPRNAPSTRRPRRSRRVATRCKDCALRSRR